ncbi:glycosyltransferase family 4 protein [Georgenia sp. M64]|uniref:glycosyltransferase family 4 protein n=1 Tax=Georgenia sp. M64 TaxID=3120520 RepID=UPI0030E5BEDE
MRGSFEAGVGMAPGPIALVASSYHPHVGGVEEHVRQVAAELRRRGRQVAVWTVDRGEHLGTAQVDGVEVRYLPCPLPSASVGGVLRFILALPPAVRAWRAAYRALRPSVLHVQCFGPNGIWAWALARRTRTPLVISSHGETSGDDHNVFEKSTLLRWSLGRAVRDASLTTGCSEVVLADLRRRFGLDDGVVVPNGVNLDEKLDPAHVQACGPVVLALGRIERTKGFDLLLRAFARADLPPGTRLALGGDGTEVAVLRALVTELGVADQVSFLGVLRRDGVAGWLDAATVLVVPSRYEAFGIVILEAWRAGTPVIATSRGGPAEIVTEGVDGLLVDPLDVDSLAAALATLLRDRDLARRLSVAGRRTVERYTWARTTDKYEELYRR